jgi:tRNA (guanine9-N1)-methyltransferase
MAELEERPSKIRKLDSPAELVESPQSSSAAQETSEIPSSEPTCDQPGDAGEEPSQDGKGEEEEKAKFSKSQLKKLRKAEQWEAGKQYRKVKRREKHKEKQARKAEQRAELRAKIASGEAATEPPKRQAEEKQKRPRRPIQVPISLILDCDFNELMSEKELISLGAQLTRCYSDNKKTPYRSHLALSSWGGTLKSRFETVLTNNHLGWKGVKFYEEDFMVAAENLDEIMRSPSGGNFVGAFAKDIEDTLITQPTLLPSVPAGEGSIGHEESNLTAESVDSQAPETSQNFNGSLTADPESTFTPTVDTNSQRPLENPSLEEDPTSENTVPAPKPTPSIVYLTSDSPYTLESLSPNTSYIIGGIVDKNRHKGLCYHRACERGIPTAKLPIGEYMTMQSRSVLAINHVVEIMLKWLLTGDWGEAFLSVIPKRKEAKLKVKRGDENQGEEEESEGEEEGGASVLENMKDEREKIDEGEEFDGIR